MARHLAFLRAINVGGHVVTMDVLKRNFTKMGFASVETFIASGNVIFEARAVKAAALERTIETALGKTLGYEVATFVRTVDELAAIAYRAPFPRARLDEAAAFVVGFLSAPLEAAAVPRLMALRTDFDDFHVDPKEIYWLSRRRQGESTFSNAAFEKAVGVKTTFRSMTTIRKMALKYTPAHHGGRRVTP
jgi:uncharacterized protein (DUF1697 family)